MLPIQTTFQYMDVVQAPHHFYEFIFKSKSPSRPAFDNWIAGVEQLYHLPSETPLKLLTNALAIDDVPLMYFLQQSRLLLKKYPQHPKMRVALVMSEGQRAMDKVLMTFAQMLRTGDDIRALYGDKRDEAITWLFADEPENHPAQKSDIDMV